MLYTAIAFFVMTASILLVLTNLRQVADDTVQALAGAVARARESGCVVPALAYGALWVLIFSLSYF